MYQKIILKNGLGVLLVPLKNSYTVEVLALVATGSKYELQKESGVSHFLEHMFFKGTNKRPTSFDISKELDRVGGVYNAFTSKETTGFYVHLNSKHVGLGLDIVSDILLHSRLEPSQIENEKKVILEELNMIQDSPRQYISDLWEKLLYGSQPAGRFVIGTRKTIQSVSRQMLAGYLQSQYVAPNILLVIAGRFNRSQLLKDIRKYFLEFEDRAAKPKEKVEESQSRPEVLVHFKKTDQTHLILGVRAYPLLHPNRYALAVLATVLGGNMSSRLFEEVREKKALAYYISTSPEAYTDSGYLATQAGINNQKVEEAIKVILKEYHKIRTKKVDLKELKRAKEFLKGRMSLSLQTPPDFAQFFGLQQILTNKILTPEQVSAKIDKVSRGDVLKVAQDIFQLRKLNLALIGPFRNKEKFQQLLRL